MRTFSMRFVFSILTVFFAGAAIAAAQSAPSSAPSQRNPASASGPAQTAVAQGPVRITLDEAIQLALQHNHAILAARNTIEQSQDLEITANLRPDPVLIWDAQFLPVFHPNQFSSDYLDNSAQFDLGLSYFFERGKKRQHRLQAARDQTAVTRSQVADNERALTFQVATQFVNAQLAESTLELAEKDLKSFQDTVDISKARYQAGDISEDDYLKIDLQLLQFQTDVQQSKLARVQALADLRQLLGYESVSPDYDVSGDFDYIPLQANLEDLQAKALQDRPDLRAAQQGVTEANSLYLLAKANGKRDITAQINYTHVSDANTASFFASMQLPIFDRNQGEIARTHAAITQAQELQRATSGQVLTDVRDAYEGLQTNDQVVTLYRSGYLKVAQDDLDISEYAYKRGAASLLNFLDAERSYRATQLAYRQALASYLLALEQLREAVGVRSLP
ncbi:MAG TPA: TolC family protein [Candidatus Acidoferrales bacterium]|nr:TolC family protein [Candidatus Acidoferrales bacterium]